MYRSIVDVFGQHQRVIDRLLDVMPRGGLQCKTMSKGRTVGKMLAHMHAHRVGWLDSLAPDLSEGLPQLEKAQTVDAAALRAALRSSGRAVQALILRALQTGRLDGFEAGPLAFGAYLIAHEWYHVGEIGISLDQGGHPLPHRIAVDLWDAWRTGGWWPSDKARPDGRSKATR